MKFMWNPYEKLIYLSWAVSVSDNIFISLLSASLIPELYHYFAKERRQNLWKHQQIFKTFLQIEIFITVQIKDFSLFIFLILTKKKCREKSANERENILNLIRAHIFDHENKAWLDSISKVNWLALTLYILELKIPQLSAPTFGFIKLYFITANYIHVLKFPVILKLKAKVLSILCKKGRWLLVQFLQLAAL